MILDPLEAASAGNASDSRKTAAGHGPWGKAWCASVCVVELTRATFDSQASWFQRVVLCLRLEQSCVDLWLLLPNFSIHSKLVYLCMVWSLVRDSWLLGSWYELLRHNWNSAARLLHYVTIALGVCVCVCVVQYCAVSMLLRTVLVLRGSQWQSRFSCFDAANPFARSGLRVLDDTHIVRILINRLSKAFRMLWLLPGKVDSAQLVWGNVSAGGAGPNTSASSRKTQNKIPPVGCGKVLKSCAVICSHFCSLLVELLSSQWSTKEWTATTGVPAKYPLFFELLGLNIEVQFWHDR